LFPSIAPYGSLLANMEEHRSRGDPNILVLDVSAERTRRFVTEEEQRGVELTLQVSRSSLAWCLRILPVLELIVLLAVMVYFGYFGDAEVVHILAASRAMRFSIVYLVIFLLLAISKSVRASQAYLNHKKHRDMKNWLQELWGGSQQLLLFCNASAAEGSQGGPAENLAGKSMISFTKRKVFFFSRTRDVGPLIKTTYVRLVHADGQSDNHLELTTVVKAQGAMSAVRAEVIHRMPLEPQHVAQVRGWLQLHQEVFNFEISSENQEVQLGAMP